MYKGSMELTRINKNIKLNFGIVLRGDGNSNTKLMSTFDKDSNRYFKITPYPFLTVDISRKDKQWSPNDSVVLSGMNKFLFQKALKTIHRKMIQSKDLFYYMNGELKVNKDLSKNCVTTVGLKGKTCQFIPLVVVDEENEQDGPYEGIVMMINTQSNYATMTFEELEYFIDYLERLDMNTLTLTFINTVKIKDLSAQNAFIENTIKKAFNKVLAMLTASAKEHKEKEEQHGDKEV